MADLVITDLHVDVETESGPKQILKGVNLTINTGEVHAIMGPNGSGKSTLAYAIAGHPKYKITQGSVKLDGVELTELSVDERAKAGLFLAMQYPVEVPGVSTSNFLRTAKTALDGVAPKVRTWPKEIAAALERLEDGPELQRPVDQRGLLQRREEARRDRPVGRAESPSWRSRTRSTPALDIDAIRIVADGVNRFADQGDRGVLLITHYTRILRYIHPSHVHVFVDGQVVAQGGKDLAEELEVNGYDQYLKAARV